MLKRSVLMAVATIAATAVAATTSVATPASPSDRVSDPFFKYTGAKPLAEIAPGTVLKKRTVQYQMGDLYLPLEATQLLYRSTSMIGKPTVNVTSVVKPWWSTGPSKVVGYGSFYDSLDPRDQPSLAIAGNSNATVGGALANVESLTMVLPLLQAGYTVVVTDTEGQNAAFAAGPEYGMNTLDGLRAAASTPESGIAANTKIGLMGYSGGAIATEWAAELAPTYAPDIDARLVGATMGGVLVHPDHNLSYIEGSSIWAGVMPMALVGISRAFEIDLSPYMNDYGKKLFADKQYASIVDALFQFPGLKFEQLTKPEYPTPESIPVYVQVANQLIMGQDHTPTKPMQIFQGAGGEAEGTSGNTPGIGPGDGVMVAGDVRSLARKYCAKGVPIEYRQFDGLSHIGSTSSWIPAAIPWLNARFAGEAAPENCADIAPGNSLDPVKAAVDPEQPVVNPPVVPTPVIRPPAELKIPDLPAAVSSPSTATPLAAASDKPVAQPRATVTSVRARGTSVVIKFRCTAPSGASCKVKTGVTARSGARTRTVATRTVTIPAGRTKTVTVKLSSTGRRLVRQKKRIKATITANQIGVNKTTRIKRTTLTLRVR